MLVDTSDTHRKGTEIEIVLNSFLMEVVWFSAIYVNLEFSNKSTSTPFSVRKDLIYTWVIKNILIITRSKWA